MPTEMDDVLSQLKDIVESFKGVGQYAKDLTSALHSSVRPMQQLSDLTKAIQSQTEATSKFFEKMEDILGDVAKTTTDVADKMKEIDRTQESSNRKLDEAKLKQIESRTVLNETQTKKLEQEMQLSAEYAKQTAEGQKRNEMARALTGTMQDLIGATSKWHQELAMGKHEWNEITKKMEQVKAGSPKLAAAMAKASSALTGQADIGQAIGKVGSGIGSVIGTLGPVGGLIGAIVYGINQDAEWKAVGNSVAQQFDTIGGHTAAFAAKMGSLSRDLTKWGYIAQGDLLEVGKSFAKLGVSQEEAEAKFKNFSSVAGDSVLALSLSFDKLLEVGAGTSAELAGGLSANLNTSIEESLDLMVKMTGAAEASGASVKTFMQQIMDASSSLKFMNANIEAVIANQAGMSKGMQDMKFGRQFANQYAAAGAANLAGAVPNMNMGVAAVLAQDMGMGSGLEAYYRLTSPVGRALGAGGKATDLDMGEMYAKMQERLPGQTRAEKHFAAQQLYGLDKAGADALLDYNHQAAKSGVDQKKTLEKIADGMKDERTKQNELAAAINVIKDAVAQIMVGLLGLIVAGLKTVYNAIMWLGNTLMSSPLVNPLGGEKEKNLADMYGGFLVQNVADMGNAGTRIASQADRIRGAGGKIAEDVFSTRGTEWSAEGWKRRQEIEKKYGGGGEPLTYTEQTLANLAGGPLAAKIVKELKGLYKDGSTAPERGSAEYELRKAALEKQYGANLSAVKKVLDAEVSKDGKVDDAERRAYQKAIKSVTAGKPMTEVKFRGKTLKVRVEIDAPDDSKNL